MKLNRSAAFVASDVPDNSNDDKRNTLDYTRISLIKIKKAGGIGLLYQDNEGPIISSNANRSGIPSKIGWY